MKQENSNNIYLSIFLVAVFDMPNKQLADLVNRLKKSGITISLTKPRLEVSVMLEEMQQADYHHDNPPKQEKSSANPTMLHFI